MAKLSAINKNNKRIKLTNKFYAKRKELKKQPQRNRQGLEKDERAPRSVAIQRISRSE